MEVKYDNK